MAKAYKAVLQDNDGNYLYPFTDNLPIDAEPVKDSKKFMTSGAIHSAINDVIVDYIVNDSDSEVGVFTIDSTIEKNALTVKVKDFVDSGVLSISLNQLDYVFEVERERKFGVIATAEIQSVTLGTGLFPMNTIGKLPMISGYDTVLHVFSIREFAEGKALVRYEYTRPYIIAKSRFIVSGAGSEEANGEYVASSKPALSAITAGVTYWTKTDSSGISWGIRWTLTGYGYCWQIVRNGAMPFYQTSETESATPELYPWESIWKSTGIGEKPLPTVSALGVL